MSPAFQVLQVFLALQVVLVGFLWFIGSFVGAVSAAAPGPGSGQGKAYEVTRASSGGSSASSGWYVYGVIGGPILIGLAAFGFLRGSFKI